MKAAQIPSLATHRAVAAVPEEPGILAVVVSQLRTEFGHGCSWRTGAAYVRLQNGELVVVPSRFVKAVVKKYGRFVQSVNGQFVH